ncbi:sigma-70 family RNA polymerase sigma factor [Galbibacter sp. BG1]|uniref:RNA polymerase sigma factor n=1 Tax=Galbibacter sp. BG1 TaxID=1170699 RepID=UPI0015B8F497|nr:sigma-70 family RNA polymerase sigma factor [Galbibacter sp. BG1]QLE01712.1 sigma-70 family RNA polymerase sigma factor [Galbibacter sp. BG1]
MQVTAQDIKEHIHLAKKGDQKSFSFLLNNFWIDVYSFQLLRTRNENEAEDITIRTFSRAFDKIESYNDEYEFKTWLITISKNIHIDLIRKKQSEVSHKTLQQEDSNIYNVADSTPSAEDNLITEQNLASLLQHIKKLKPHYQEVINLRYFQELSYAEIAKELNEPLNNVKVKLLRAKKLLAEIIHQKKK